MARILNAKRWAAVLIAAAAATGLLAGCQGVEVRYDQRIVVQVKETTGENPVNVTVKVDGKEVFGPADLNPTDPAKNIEIHNPTSDAGPKLTPGTVHRISWRLHRNGMMGKVGNADLTIFSGNQVVKSASTKYIPPEFWIDGFVDIKLTPPAAGAVERPGPATGQPPTRSSAPAPAPLPPSPTR